MELNKIGCQNCGAELLFDPGTQMTNCNFCGSNFAIENSTKSEIITPDGILPFSVGKDQYESSVLQWLSEGDYTPDDILQSTVFESVNGLYFPMWHFSGQYNGNWSASSGYYRWEEYFDRDSSGKLVKKTRRVTDWRPSSGQVAGKFSLLGFAGEDIKKDIVTYSHGTGFNRGELKPFDIKYTLGFNLLDFKKDEIDTWETHVEPQAQSIAREDAKRRVPGDTYKDFYCDILYTKEKSLRIYIPFWITYYTYNETEYHVYMDGTSVSRLQGVRPEDQNRKKEVQKKFIPGHIALVIFIIAIFATQDKNFQEPTLITLSIITLIAYGIGFYQKNKIINTSKEKRRRILEAYKNGESIDAVLKEFESETESKNSNIKEINNQLKSTNKESINKTLIISLIVIAAVSIITIAVYFLNKSGTKIQETVETKNEESYSENAYSLEPTENDYNRSDFKQNESTLEIKDISYFSGEYQYNEKIYFANWMRDSKYDTWWTPDPPNGEGAYATFEFQNRETCLLSGFRIMNGSYGKYYYDNSRVTLVRFIFNDGNKEEFELNPNNQEFQNFKFSNNHLSTSIRMEVIGTIQGSRWNDVCISEIEFIGYESNNETWEKESDLNNNLSNDYGQNNTLIICGSYENQDRAIQRKDELESLGLGQFIIIQSNDYSNLRPGLYCVIAYRDENSSPLGLFDKNSTEFSDIKNQLEINQINHYSKKGYK